MIFGPKRKNEEQIHESLSKTRKGIFGAVKGLFQANEITDDLWEDLEALLVQADVGIETTTKLVEKLKDQVRSNGIKKVEDVYTLLKADMVDLLESNDRPMELWEPRLLTVVLIVGVNGSGKTTSIAKLAYYAKNRGKKVVLAAADTFRAAAIDQLKIWGERIGVDVIAHQPGADPGAVVYDAIRAAQESRKADMVIIDTAGRLHTKYNLMKELEKIRGIAAKQVHKAPHETFLVLDATNGQNALYQAKAFKESVEITGVILAKLDGTAKGGVVFGIAEELGVPVRFIGTGETVEDFAEFDPRMFVESLFE